MRQIGTYDPEVVVLEVTDSVKAWAIGHGSRSRLSPMCKRCRRGRAGGTRARRSDNNNNNVPAARRRKTSRERERACGLNQTCWWLWVARYHHPRSISWPTSLFNLHAYQVVGPSAAKFPLSFCAASHLFTSLADWGSFDLSEK